MTTRERVRQFIVDNFYVTDPAEVRDDTLLVTTGVVDSTGVLEVIGFLETEFGWSPPMGYRFLLVAERMAGVAPDVLASFDARGIYTLCRRNVPAAAIAAAVERAQAGEVITAKAAAAIAAAHGAQPVRSDAGKHRRPLPAKQVRSLLARALDAPEGGDGARPDVRHTGGGGVLNDHYLRSFGNFHVPAARTGSCRERGRQRHGASAQHTSRSLLDGPTSAISGVALCGRTPVGRAVNTSKQSVAHHPNCLVAQTNDAASRRVRK